MGVTILKEVVANPKANTSVFNQFQESQFPEKSVLIIFK